MKLYKIPRLLLLVLFASSCASQKIIYFEDMAENTEEKVLNIKEIKIQPDDKISIIVNCKNAQLSNLFNLPYVSQQLGQVGDGSSSGNSQGVSGYTVDEEGFIIFPIIGKIHVAGLNRNEIAEHIASELISRDLVKEPVVTVEFLNLTFSVLGEVNNPGRFVIDKDKISLLEGLSLAGDLTLHGQRDKIVVQRQENGKQKIYHVDLNSGYSLYASPVYYLQQNDIVYVEPNKYKAKDATVNNKVLRWTSTWLAIVSLLSTITFAIIK